MQVSLLCNGSAEVVTYIGERAVLLSPRCLPTLTMSCTEHSQHASHTKGQKRTTLVLRCVSQGTQFLLGGFFVKFELFAFFRLLLQLPARVL